MRLAGLIAVVAGGLMGLVALAAPAPSPWDQPAAALAEQIAEFLGPGQAHLTIRNLSTIPTDDVPAIRKLMEQDLKAHGVTVAGEESANLIRITLSENARERLWVAEVVEGSETRVTMVHLALDRPQATAPAGGIMLRKQVIFTSREPLLAALETPNGLVTLEPEQIVIYAHASDGWHEQKRVGIGQRRPIPRDPRGILLRNGRWHGVRGMAYRGPAAWAATQPAPSGDWQVQCVESDDPWTIVQVNGTGGLRSRSRPSTTRRATTSRVL